jgi:hypothetical protein
MGGTRLAGTGKQSVLRAWRRAYEQDPAAASSLGSFGQSVESAERGAVAAWEICENLAGWFGYAEGRGYASAVAIARM